MPEMPRCGEVPTPIIDSPDMWQGQFITVQSRNQQGSGRGGEYGAIYQKILLLGVGAKITSILSEPQAGEDQVVKMKLENLS